MDNKEFKELVLEIASKYLNEKKLLPKEGKVKKDSLGENITANQIKMLAEEMKKINKKIDLRNPVINPDFFNKVKEDGKGMDCQKNRWKNLCEYKVVDDDNLI